MSFKQILLESKTMSLDKNEYNSVVNNINLFSSVGFDIEDFGLGSIIIRSSPTYLKESEISDAIIEIAEYISKNKNDITTRNMEWLYCSMACRSAIKAGDKNQHEEINYLIEQIKFNKKLNHCPHGRPILINIDRKEIEKWFSRV